MSGAEWKANFFMEFEMKNIFSLLTKHSNIELSLFFAIITKYYSTS